MRMQDKDIRRLFQKAENTGLSGTEADIKNV